MISFQKILLPLLIVFSLGGVFVVLPDTVVAVDVIQQPCNNPNTVEKPKLCGDAAAENPITAIITTATNIISAVVGIAAVIMIIVSGMRFITSAGDPAGTKGARNGIIYAAIGLVIIAIARSIVLVVVNNVSK